jgi:hypothetical protein
MLLHLDNFAHYGGTLANLLQLYSSHFASSFQTDRWGVASGALRLGSSDSCQLSVSGSPSTLILGFAVKFTNFGTSGTSIVALLETAIVHCGIGINLAGQIFAWRGTTATVLGTSATALLTGSWYYIEAKFVLHDTTGSVTVKVDGTTVLSLTNVDTRNAGTPLVNGVRYETSGGATTDYCDLYVADTTGTTNNDFLGDTRVRELYPNGAGTYTDFTPSAGSNYQAVDETAQDGDTTYVQSSTVGHKDTYAYTDLATSPTIKGARLLLLAKKDDAGARSIAPTVKSGATEDDGTTAALSTSYVYYSKIWETDPNTSAAWTAANLNAAEFGVEVKA